MIEVNNLVKSFGTFTAVRGISFTAEPGQVTGFLGPNGAGKTTTMRMLTGFAPPTSGTATVAGYDIFDQSKEVRKNVGYLPESVPLYRDMTALGYLNYLGEIRGVKNRKSRCQDVLERVGLAKRAYSEIRTLSKGMRQRVGLAAALIHDPEVLILDEPTIGLDPIQVLELRDLITELGQNHTVMFSTHILSEAEQVCDRVVIINQGMIMTQGDPVALRSQMERGARILVRTAEDPSKSLETVQQVASVMDAEIERDSIIAYPANPEHDPRAEITRALVTAGFNVLEVRPAANNLEEIFLEVTRRSNLAEDDAPEIAVTYDEAEIAVESED
ncbi:MAG: ATP-binding cassette domain-containing protein [Phototrophicaceae bacterium]